MSTLPPDSAPRSAPAVGADHDALPPGTRFGEFEIVRVLGVGGFGIVYLANDHSLEREVALKEYMPASLAARGAGPQITVRSSSFAETYAIGLRSFVNEARLLARFDHPSLVKVYRFWEDNATAYMVMPYLQGVTLRDTRRRMAHPPDEAWIRSVVSPILAALELLHREGVYHRDIAPDNILLQAEGPPILLDFGAARRVISDRTQSLTAILKPSYAPIEQYAEMTQLRQGPWTDLYALGAVIHYLLFGAPPAPATARAVQDDAEAIENRIVPGVSPRFLEAVAWMLSVRPNQRPQNGEQLRAVLDGHAQVPPRGRPGITIPPNVALPGMPPPSAHPPTQPPGPTHRPQVETAADATQVNTAHMPTHLPTAHMPPAGRTQAPPTTFGPTGQMPTARPPQQTTEFDPSLAPRAAPMQPRTQPPPMPPAGGPRSDAAPSQWPPSRPGTLPPPMPPQSRPAPLMAQAQPEAARSRPAPLPPAAAMPVAKAGGSSKAGLMIAGVVGLLVVAAAAAWQFSPKDKDPVDSAAAAASATMPSPVVPATATVAIPPPAPVTTAAPPPAITTAPPATTPSPTPTATTAALPPQATVATPPPIEPVRPTSTTTATTGPTTAHPPATDPVKPPPSSRPPPQTARVDPSTDPIARPSSTTTATLPADRSTPTRPSGQAVPRDTATAGGAPGPSSTSRPPESSSYGNPYGTPSTTSNATPPRPVGQPVQRDAAGRPVPSSTPPATAAATAAATPPAADANAGMIDPFAKSARESCGKRVFIALAICMEERCEDPRWRNGGECPKILERKRQREGR